MTGDSGKGLFSQGLLDNDEDFPPFFIPVQNGFEVPEETVPRYYRRGQRAFTPPEAPTFPPRLRLLRVFKPSQDEEALLIAFNL